jgi:methyl-accepting chemotaxis protein
LDQFESDALSTIERNPRTEFYRLEEYKGQFSMRYAIADVMLSGCVPCHNSHPETPKSNWKQGDVRGVVEVVMPLEEAREGVAQFSQGMIGGLIVMLIVIIGAILTMLRRTIVRPITNLRDVSQNLDLTVDIQVNTRDEVGELAGAFNTFIQKLRDTIGQVAQVTESVASAATELSSTSEEIAAGAEETSTQGDTVAAATEQMSATAGEIAQNCSDAVQASETAASAADSGRTVVQQAVDGMNQIATRVQESAQNIQALNESAERIGEIISVIDDIADQTNLLALNAAIEAARAGEQGRGFAVVADEVRKLAESTAQSTREIGTMIQTIQTETQQAVTSMEKGVQDVETGTQLASQAGSSLDAITEQIVAVADMIRQVATAAEEQTATTGDIAQNIQQVAEVTQQSAQGAQQSVQAAVELAEFSNQLQQLIGQFKLSESGTSHFHALVSPQAAFAAAPTDR